MIPAGRPLGSRAVWEGAAGLRHEASEMYFWQQVDETQAPRLWDDSDNTLNF
jgi:hypothetical protein